MAAESVALVGFGLLCMAVGTYIGWYSAHYECTRNEYCDNLLLGGCRHCKWKKISTQ